MTSILEEDENVVELRMKEAGLQAGGRYEPTECQSQQKIAIIVPVRNREDHLTVFLRYMHPFLQRKQIGYVIIVVEQSGEFTMFNCHVAKTNGRSCFFLASQRNRTFAIQPRNVDEHWL